MPQLCAICFSLSVTRQGFSFTQQNRVPSVSTYNPSFMTACHPHYYSEKEERATQRQTVKKREGRHALKATAHYSWGTFTVHQSVCVGMTSQACQSDGVLKLGQEERCSSCCQARVNIMVHWPRSCTDALLCHRDAKTRSTHYRRTIPPRESSVATSGMAFRRFFFFFPDCREGKYSQMFIRSANGVYLLLRYKSYATWHSAYEMIY